MTEHAEAFSMPSNNDLSITTQFSNNSRWLQSMQFNEQDNEIITKELHAVTMERGADYIGIPHEELTEHQQYLNDLDINHGVDVVFVNQFGCTKYVQCKALSYDHDEPEDVEDDCKPRPYNSITIEYMDNPNKKGDWFRCKAHYLLVGYDKKNHDGRYSKWALLNCAALEAAMNRYSRTDWKERINKNNGARASFLYCEANELFTKHPQAFVAQSNMLSPSNVEELACLQLLYTNPIARAEIVELAKQAGLL